MLVGQSDVDPQLVPKVVSDILDCTKFHDISNSCSQIQIALGCSVYNILELHPDVTLNFGGLFKGIFAGMDSHIEEVQLKCNVNRVLCFQHSLRFAVKNDGTSRLDWPYIDFEAMEVKDRHQIQVLTSELSIQK